MSPFSRDFLRGVLWAVERVKRHAYRQRHRGDWALLVHVADTIRAEAKAKARSGEQMPLVEGT